MQWCEFPSWKEGKFEYWSFEAPLAICWALLTSQIDVSLNCVSDWIIWGNQLLTLDVYAVQPLENDLFLFLSPSVQLFVCVSLEYVHTHAHTHKHTALTFCFREQCIFCVTVSCRSYTCVSLFHLYITIYRFWYSQWGKVLTVLRYWDSIQEDLKEWASSCLWRPSFHLVKWGDHNSLQRSAVGINKDKETKALLRCWW